MISNEAIKAVLLENDRCYEPIAIEITRDGDFVTIEACRMYEYLPLPFKTLMKLAELFQTTEIEEPSRWFNSGCESCDYGSQYKWTLRIKEPKPNRED